MDYSPSGSFVHGILQARILEWVDMPSSRGSFWPRDRTYIFCIVGSFLTTEEAQARLMYQNKQWLKCSKSLFLTLIKYSSHKWFSWKHWFKDPTLSSLRLFHVSRPYHYLGGRESRVSFLKVLAHKYLTSDWLEFSHMVISSCKGIWEIQSCVHETKSTQTLMSS